VYMIHTIFGKIVVGLSNKLPPPPSPFVGALLLAGVFASLLLVSTLSFHFFENPARKWLTKRWESRPQGR
jgi:peptidoglycan/LPS O-acetylase OafA/YrhL